MTCCIYSQLRNVVDQVENTPVEQRQAPVGLLTTEHRDTWGPVSFRFMFDVIGFDIWNYF